jgi:hypothetical protein
MGKPATSDIIMPATAFDDDWSIRKHSSETAMT